MLRAFGHTSFVTRVSFGITTFPSTLISSAKVWFNKRSNKIYNPNKKSEKITLIGNDQDVEVKRLTIPDVYAAVSYIGITDYFQRTLSLQQ